MSTLQPGSTLQNGKYEIQRKLGQGGFGITYLALQHGLNRTVAIKEFFMDKFCVRNADTHHVTIAAEGSRDFVNRYREKFLKEARNIAKLEHPNIVSIIDVFEENSTAYYVMKYAQNGSLEDKVKREGHLSEAEATRYILKVADALRFVHQHKITHLDVKPENILLSDKDEPWLIDFGLSKQYDVQTGEQTSSTPLGYSPGYAPIEQYMAGGAGTFSPESDIYSLGATFFKLLTGVTPPNASSVANEGLPIQALKDKGVSQQTIYAIFQAMEPLRKDRLHDMETFIKLLTEEQAPNKPAKKQAKAASTELYHEGEAMEEVAGTPPPKPARKRTEAASATKPNKGQTAASTIQPPAPPKPKRASTQTGAASNRQRSPMELSENPPTSQIVGHTGSLWRKLILGVIVFFVIAAIVFGCFAVLGAMLTDDSPVEKNDSLVTPQAPEGPMTFEANGVSFKMMPVEGGTFLMGATPEQEKAESNEMPTHQVTLSNYFIGETEVTQALWQAVMGTNPSYNKGDDLPVEQVSWGECLEFINRLNALTGQNFRLPTEAEWEFAARGGNKSGGYQYSGSNHLSSVAWYKRNSDKHTYPVKTKAPNELGVYDMSGNVWEWCSDWDGDYSSANQTNPVGPSTGTRRVNRGGGCRTADDRSRITYRGNDSPETRDIGLGLRLALSE